ncbi:MAG: hypothetical protein KKG33_11130 [candidate division Zixibacteria bacterium]|nr:hypothetical protein [candidate division Zixibacteria bacterium]MBU1469711.1 hypothetical protein [candidate division Zixibacteria bacterium]MBU2626101.1 hypothetical protein [candidate division Zixibacteria bacterium]
MKKLRSNSGFTMIIFLALLLMLTLIGINSVMTSTVEVNIAGNEVNYMNSFYAAEAALEKASTEMAHAYRTTGAAPHPLPSGTLNLGRFAVTYTTTQTSASETKDLSNGTYRGLYALATPYEITATATAGGTETEATLVQGIECDLVPLFQFAVFYENDLEIAPGPPMTLGGRVHSNGNLYLQSGNQLNIDSYTSAAGNIFHGRKPGSGQSTSSGDVRIMDANGTYQEMYDSGTWLDSTDPDWVAESISRWGGMVEDSDHGITELELPVVSSGVPDNMIATATESADSYENKATLKIIDGVASYQQIDGSWIDVTAALIAEGSLTTNSFYDAHQGNTVNSWDIDMSNFKNSAYFPSNGIMYTANTTGGANLKATRLVNASDIGQPFTLSSRNSVYIQGDYNTVNKKPSAVMTDALTILSNNWNDANSSQPLSNRNASETTVNCSYMTGNQNTGEGGSAYNGGFENLPRFLEQWSGIDFNWMGSAVDLWLSKEANAPWSYGAYYTAPNRNWAFDEDLKDPTKLPPGTPLIAIMQKVSWMEKVVAEN